MTPTLPAADQHDPQPRGLFSSLLEALHALACALTESFTSDIKARAALRLIAERALSGEPRTSEGLDASAVVTSLVEKAQHNGQIRVDIDAESIADTLIDVFVGHLVRVALDDDDANNTGRIADLWSWCLAYVAAP